MCPQADVSSVLLANIRPCQRGVNDSTEPMVIQNEVSYRKTVYGYLLASLEGNCIEQGNSNFIDFLYRVNSKNSLIPKNLLLMCGDLRLEAFSRRLEHERLQRTSNDNPWKKVTLLIKDYIERISRQNTEYVFFIDTNPTFSVYTEMAISAAERLIVPFNANDFSLSAIRGVFNLVYGYPTDEHERFKEYQYNCLAEANSIQRPKLHLLVNNRATYYHTRASVAYSAVEIEVRRFLSTCYFKNEHMFTSQSLFESRPGILVDYIMDVPDFHTAGVVSTHNGWPLLILSAGTYSVFGKKVQVNNIIDKYKTDIRKVVQRL